LAEITFSDVAKVYPDGTRAVSQFDLEISDGEFVVLVGPSGCGKTTALRMVAGLETVTEGEIRIGGRVVNDLPPKNRDVAMVFQSYALYPHMTVFDNMAFGLKLRKLPSVEIRARVERAARLLGLDEFADRKPRALSGGQRQRVAMGRAIVREPQAFLMDEPLSNLDAKLRVQMRAEISALQHDLGVTTVYVTHDQIEAMTMADRVAVIRKGLLQQVAPPQELYERPTNLFVAGFIGSPSMNVLLATPRSAAPVVNVDLGKAQLPVHDNELARALEAYDGREVVVGIRPEHLEEASLADGGRPTLSGMVKVRELLGAEVIVHVEIEARPAVTEDVRELAADTGEEETLVRQAGAQTATIVARLSPHTSAKPGERIDLAVDTSSLQVFDTKTGSSIRGGGGT
jgi:multiple sugar transport system ATP-binding protein